MRSTRAFHRGDADCRELRGENTARGKVEPFRVTVCKGADGNWLLAPTEPEPKPAPAPAADPTGFPVKLPASFSGVLPCADCPGLKYALEFHEDGSYRLRTTYLEKGPDHQGLDADDSGAWQLVSYGARVTLRNDQNKTSTFIIKDANTLRLVDDKGDRVQVEAQLRPQARSGLRAHRHQQTLKAPGAGRILPGLHLLLRLRPPVYI